jgi:hypothetical protein
MSDLTRLRRFFFTSAFFSPFLNLFVALMASSGVIRDFRARFGEMFVLLFEFFRNVKVNGTADSTLDPRRPALLAELTSTGNGRKVRRLIFSLTTWQFVSL